MSNKEITAKAKSFVLYCDYDYQLELLNVTQKGRLLEAIFAYVRTGEYPDIGDDSLVNVIFRGIKTDLDRDRKNYENKCAINAENARKGGRPRKKTESLNSEKTEISENIFCEKTERFSEKSEKPYNDNDTDTDNDTDNDNDSDNGNENESVSEEKAFGKEAPLSVSNAPIALSEREREGLLKLGVDRDYIAERETRAIRYAAEKADKSGGVSAVRENASEVLLRWWKEDRDNEKARGRREALGGKGVGNERSYDIDDFFSVAVERSTRELGL